MPQKARKFSPCENFLPYGKHNSLLVSLVLGLYLLQYLVYEGNRVTAEGRIMHEPKASALSAPNRYYIAGVH